VSIRAIKSPLNHHKSDEYSHKSPGIFANRPRLFFLIRLVIDYFTKWVEAKAVKVDNAEEVATFIYEKIIYRYGCSQKILSDRGTHFNNNMIKELMKKFEIKHTVYFQQVTIQKQMD
jgi:hypothetical protein